MSACRQCGLGTIQPKAASGRTWLIRGMMTPVPDHFEILTCTHCGRMYLDQATAEKLDAVFSSLCNSA